MKRIVFLIISVLCLTACNNEVYFVAPEIDSEEGQITLYLPDATVQTYSAATTSECYIDSLLVIEFDQGTGNLVNDTLIKGANILWNGSNIQLLPQLPFEPTEHNTIVIIANYGTITYPSTLNYSTIDDYFFRIKSQYRDYEHLPMYGEILDWSPDNAYSCEMIRAVAKIQVQLAEDLIDVTGNFSPDNVTWGLHSFGRGGYIKPQPTLRGEAFLTQSSWESNFEYFLLQKDNTLENRSVYVNEFPSSTTTGELGDVFDLMIPKVPHILPVDSFYWTRQAIMLVKKVVLSDESTWKYYRLDFYDPLKKQFIDTKRNHHYIFTIHKIGSEGYANNTSLYNVGSNIEYTVEIKDGSNHVTSNGQYAIVTSIDTAYVTVPAMNVTIATFRCQLPTKMSSLGQFPINTVTYTNYPPGRISYNPIGSLPITTTDRSLVASVIYPDFDSARVDMQLGNIAHRIMIIKKP
jgi:hypothetical protein